MNNQLKAWWLISIMSLSFAGFFAMDQYRDSKTINVATEEAQDYLDAYLKVNRCVRMHLVKDYNYVAATLLYERLLIDGSMKVDMVNLEEAATIDWTQYYEKSKVSGVSNLLLPQICNMYNDKLGLMNSDFKRR